MISAIQWILCFIPAIIVEIICYLTNPIVCLFAEKKPRTDVVKRLNKQVLTLQRDYLIKPFYLWQTHDNAVDEGWYGLYSIPFLANKTQIDYDNSALIRYWCRLWWLSRNTAYGWQHLLFSKPKETANFQYEYGTEYLGFWLLLQTYNSSFHLECHIPLPFNRYNSLNIGWKPHKNINKLLYANRLIGIRKYNG